MEPRWYQSKLINGTREAWAQGAKNVMVVSPPRSGKTPTMMWLSKPFLDRGDSALVMVHREELVSQIAMTYAKNGIYHRIIAPSDVISSIIHKQIKTLGRSFVNSSAQMMIGSVQTINARLDSLKQDFARVRFWGGDEGHHFIPGSYWGNVVESLPGSAVGAAFTATPSRLDRKSLARSQGGLFDVMVKGVTARELIDQGYICDYRVVAPKSSLNRGLLKVGSSGDFTKNSLSAMDGKAKIVGDCVSSYMEHTPGQQAVAYAVDIDHANDMTEAFRKVGIDAATISSKTPKAVRKELMSKFDRGVLQVVCNVDLFGEGLDIGGIHVVIMGRPTQSLTLFMQQFYRSLTSADEKTHGWVIDHVDNIRTFARFYGLPDRYNAWTLENEERGKRRERDPSVIPATTCTRTDPFVCTAPYERIHKACPFCGFEPEPEGRSRPEQVDGDMMELDHAVLMELQAAARAISGDDIDLTKLSGLSQIKAANFNETLQAQRKLRETIALWAGVWRDRGADDSQIYRRFYLRFGVDIGTAQTLRSGDAKGLTDRILSDNFG